MEIDSAMLAMGAEASPDGILHIFKGGFDSVEVAGIPGLLPPFWIVARATKTGVTEEEWHSYEIEIVNPVGESKRMTKEGGARFNLKPPELPGSPSRSSLLTQVLLQANHTGIYRFQLIVDGQYIKELFLQIKEHVPAQGE